MIRTNRSTLDNFSRHTDSYLPMSLMEWFWPDPRLRAIGTLEAVAARYRSLAANLREHAEICKYPTIRAGLEGLAAREEIQTDALKAFLANEGRKLETGVIVHLDGASNWQRLKADLALQTQMLSDLNRAIVLLEGHDHHAAARLRDIAAEEERNLCDLGDLVLKCDTQALD